MLLLEGHEQRPLATCAIQNAIIFFFSFLENNKNQDQKMKKMM